MAGAWIEAQLQLTADGMAGQRSTILLLLGMLAWIVAAIAGSLIVWGALALAWRILGATVMPEPSRLVYTLCGALGFHGTLLLVALRQGRRIGGGDWRVGLAIGRVRHKFWVVLFCVLMIGWLIAVLALAAAIPALHDFMKSMTPEFLLSDLGDASPSVMAMLLGLTVILAPVAEELFFRGWLWEALRRRGHAIATTACITATPWLLLHGIESPGRIIFLLPAAVIFSVARQIGGGVLASLTVHIANNLSVVLVQALATLVGHGQA